ncbi:MAG: enoyl-CoA hydratase/isomerase family protein [Alphaproteobacteria bacterium]
MDYRDIMYSKRDHVGTITLNRPQFLNAMTTRMLEEIEDAINTIERDRDVIVAVITGAGEKAFCAGIDLEETVSLDGMGARASGKRIHRTDKAVRQLEKPVIAKVRGLCLGAGLELAISCDMIIGTETSRYGLPHMRIGIASIVEAAILPQAIGIFRAKELCFSADYWDGKKAESVGLINRAVPEAELDKAVDELAQKLCGWSPVAMGVQKTIINQWMDTDLQAAIDHSINSTAIVFDSKDQKEGMAAFLEKRKPVFKGW